MQVTETLSDGLKRASVVVPAADIEAKRAERLTELGRTAQLPGFRPARCRPVVNKRYGTAADGEVLEESVNQATQGAERSRPAPGAAAQDRAQGRVRRGQGPGVQGRARAAAGDHQLDFADIELDRLKAEAPDEGRRQGAGSDRQAQPRARSRSSAAPGAKGEVLRSTSSARSTASSSRAAPRDDYRCRVGSGRLHPGLQTS